VKMLYYKTKLGRQGAMQCDSGNAGELGELQKSREWLFLKDTTNYLIDNSHRWFPGGEVDDNRGKSPLAEIYTWSQSTE
jgi:hypothetical protein